MPHHIPLGAGAEFDAIRAMLARYGDRATGIGDDAAVLAAPTGESLVVSVDAAVEGVHFRREWMTPEEIGFRAAVAALSDLAAMAATPVGLLVAVALPDTWRAALPDLAGGVADAARDAKTQVVGGNVSAASELSLTITVIGTAASPLARRGARPGDAIWVTGRLGGPRRAVQRLERGEALDPHLRERFLRPRPRLREARWLADHGAHAAIDVSDGLLADLGHVAAASGVRIEVELERLPVVAGSAPEEGARSGEEYELAVAASPSLDAATFSYAHALPLTAVGRVVEGAAEVVATLGGVRVASASGHDHLSR
ncbi:MAG TPA: thiamine-phosphate kinase [Gemmatimonadaceae bacterium]|nr:thiamine-phosphate kinase [Gemmatimonadaceae bacterium]